MQPYNNPYLQDDQQQQYPDWIYTFMPSYSGKAFLVFVLYFCGYLPGLVINIALLLSALDTKDRFGRSPDGLGCLVALLLLFTVGPVIFLGLSYFLLTNWTRF